ncbi:MAG: Por secretion system C-terminal sorting protein [Bacteroidetes bacterium]|nr:Por secretion system C-terminal sorting protein [Bacteroidota bacterium]
MAKGILLHIRIIVLSLFVLLLSVDSVLAQTMTYYVQLRDKQHSTYSLSRPEEFLSPKAIERRRSQNIEIIENDLPVSAVYLRQIAAICPVSYSLKWSNGVVVRSDDPSVVQRLKAFPFVSGVRKISSGGPSTRHKVLDDVMATKAAVSLMDTTFYGKAARQSTMIHINSLHEKGYWGDGVIIAVMDAGFLHADSNRLMRPAFDAGRVLYTWNFVFNNSDVFGSPQANPHGCETFSCISANRPYEMVGTAPNASFLLFQTEDERSETIVEEYNWAAAAERADSMGASVFSTSLGYTTFDNTDTIDNHSYADMTGHTTPIAIAVNRAASKGILIINSAGNEGAEAWHYIATPGDADSGVTVGAVTPASIIAAFSSRGPNSSGQVKPDVCAQGNPATLANINGAVATASGTSFSCPITAGAFACLREAFPSAPNMIIVDAVRRSCSQYSHPDGDYGYGIPDFGDAYDRLKALYPDDTIAYVSSTRIFPNPFTTSFKVIMTDLIKDSINTAELYDYSGQIVWNGSAHTITFLHNIWEITPPANLAAGVYVLSVNKTRKYRLVKK